MQSGPLVQGRDELCKRVEADRASRGPHRLVPRREALRVLRRVFVPMLRLVARRRHTRVVLAPQHHGLRHAIHDSDHARVLHAHRQARGGREGAQRRRQDPRAEAHRFRLDPMIYLFSYTTTRVSLSSLNFILFCFISESAPQLMITAGPSYIPPQPFTQPSYGGYGMGGPAPFNTYNPY